jgi:hypothetical protein
VTRLDRIVLFTVLFGTYLVLNEVIDIRKVCHAPRPVQPTTEIPLT